ncbi:MAG: LPS export ABC transporter permease LptG [Nitrospiraceae bacterium]
MTILFRYLLREYVKIFTMCFAALMTVYLVIDFFEKVRRFLRYDASVIDVLTFFALRAPGISFQIAPLAILMATLLTLGVLSRNHEITAMRSCGISVYWMASPLLCFAVVVGLVLLAFSSTVIPLTTARAEYVKTVRIERKPEPASLKASLPWARIGDHTLMNIEVIEPGGATLRGLRLYHLGSQFQLDEITEAKEAHYTEHGWMLSEGNRRQFTKSGAVILSAFDSRPIDLSQIPEDFSAWLSVESDMMTFRDMRAYIERLRKDGYSFSRFLTDYYGRVAFPFVTIIMVIVGIALSLQRSGIRGGSMAIGIGQALLVGFCYWATHSIAIALGRSGVLMPMIAGWITTLVVLTFGVSLLLKVRY